MPGGLEVRTVHFHSRGTGSMFWSGTEDPACLEVRQKKKKRMNKEIEKEGKRQPGLLVSS